MSKLSEKSLEKLKECHPLLQQLFMKVSEKFDCSVICGHRNKADQDEAVRTGKSKQPWPTSKHNSTPSMAVDVVPYPINWNDKLAFCYFAGYVKGIALGLGISVRWGGDFNQDNNLKNDSFIDMPHFELKGDGHDNA